MSICLPGHQGLLISSDSLSIFEALCWFNPNFSERHLLVPHLHSIQLRAQVLEWTLSNPLTYSILYNVHLLASYLGTMLLDDQLMNTGSHFNISLELKKATWPQLALLNVFVLLLPKASARLICVLWNTPCDFLLSVLFLLLIVTALRTIAYIYSALICQVFVNHFTC